MNREHYIKKCQILRSYFNFVLLSRSTSFTQTWLFMESFLSSFLSSSILQSTDRLTIGFKINLVFLSLIHIMDM